jgi:hypothetical protein
MSEYAKNKQELIDAIERGVHVDCFSDKFDDNSAVFFHPVVGKTQDVYRLIINKKIHETCKETEHSQVVNDFATIEELLDEMVKFKPVTEWFIATDKQMLLYKTFLDGVLGSED